jgi:hypothetical protein
MDFCLATIAYHNKLIVPLFISGFTIGSFLFSMKSTIIKTLKEEVYDTDRHQDLINQKIAFSEKKGYFEALKAFSNLLMTSIKLSFVSSILQITIGYVGTIYTSLFCLTIALLSWFYLGKALFQVQSNWNKAFDFAEYKAENENKLKVAQKKLKNR